MTTAEGEISQERPVEREAARPGTPGEAGRARPLRPFLVLWTGQALSLVGSAAVQFALIWWLTTETGSAAALATATLVGLLPQVVLGPIAGALVDRWDRKRVMLLADGLVAVASAVLAGLFLLDSAGTVAVYSFLLARALGGTFHGSAMLASTSLMVPREHLARIQGLNQVLQGGLNIVAAPLGALLVGALPMAGVLAVDVATAFFAVVPLIFIRVPRPGRSASPGASAPSRSVGREVLEGLRYLAARRGHLLIVGMAAAINLFLVPAFSLLPLLVLEGLRGGAPALGWMTSAFGLGTIAGGLVLGVWGGLRPRILTALAALVLLGVAVVALGLAPAGAVGGAVLALFVVGAASAGANGPILAVLQATVAPQFQGRVFASLGSLAGLTAPLGLLLAAPVAEQVGVRTWYLAGGAVCAAIGAAAFFAPAIVRIEETGGDARAP